MLTRLLENARRSDPGRVAIVQGTRRVTYEELHALAGRYAAGLRQADVRAGHCVTVILPNGPEFVAIFFACARLRAVMLPLHPSGTRDELRAYVTDAEARIVITLPPRLGWFAGMPTTVIAPDALLADRPDPSPSGEFTGRSLYLYTSGSTDTSKRLCCTQENLFYEALNFVETVGLTATDNILCTIPLCHSYGIGNCLLDAVYTGSTLVLLEPDESPFEACWERVLQLIRDEDIRFYPGVPYQFRILAALPAHAGADLSRVRLCVSSTDVLPQRTYEQFLERFGLPIRSLYGSTEAGSIAIDMDREQTMQFGSLGRPLANVELSIRDDSGHEVPSGVTGHIWVKSPVIPPQGYDNRPELNASAFRDGSYDTGDIGTVDARGHLIMTGRKQSFVEVGGYKVDVGEVEEVLHNHPGIRDAAVLGIDVPELGVLLKAVLVTDGTCSEAEIMSHCRERLAVFKVPRLIEFRDVLPRGPTGKLLRKELGGVPPSFGKPDAEGFARTWTAASRHGRARQIGVLVAAIRSQASITLQQELPALERSASFQSMGFDSMRAAELQRRLAQLTGLSLSITLLWNYPSIDALAAALWEKMTSQAGAGAALVTSVEP